ncbi:MAG: acyl--CoA ligase [Ignavibacteria bacterium]|nr:acyl--CoA ligase [Ignavibacteria bacterium]
MQLVHQYILESARRHPDKPAIVCDGKQYSYAELVTKINALADMFVVEGLHKGERVLILLRDKLDFVTACYAVIRAGGIAVPLPESTSLSTVQHIAKNCDPTMVLTSNSDLRDLPLLRDKLSCNFFFMEENALPSIRHTFVTSTSYAGGSADDIDRITKLMDLRQDDGALILHTSGTSGQKKGVLLTHRNLIRETANINQFTKSDSHLREFVALPLEQSFGFGRVRCVHFIGGTIVLLNGPPNPINVIQSILMNQCNGLSADPATFSLYFGLVEDLLRRIGPQMRLIELGNSPMPLVQKKKLLETFPNARICMHYGLTEASSSTSIDFPSERKRLDTAGRRSPHAEITICDDSGQRLERGKAGEILVRGDHVTPGYWNNPELTKQSFLDGHWLKTGDIGILDKDGYLIVLGRKDEMINASGIRISPLEIEEKIHEAYPESEICVVGIPDPSGAGGDIPVLCYIPRNGKTIIPSELSSLLAKRLDPNKIPRIVYRVDHFPQIENKIARHELRKRLLEGIPYPVRQLM